MAFNSTGETQFLILDSLSSGSKYGLEMIDYISTRSGGNYILKKPTLYSCLTRMEKKGWVSSSFWGESEFGGKRHYYSITDEGRKVLDELEKESANFSFNNKYGDGVNQNSQIDLNISTSEETKPHSSIYLQQDNIFSMIEKNKSDLNTQTQSQNTKQDEKGIVSPNQIDLFSFQNTTSQTSTNSYQENFKSLDENNKFNSEEQTSKERYYKSILEQNSQSQIFNNYQNAKNNENLEGISYKKDDARFLHEDERLTPDQEEQNKRLYDTSNELKKFRKKKSFSENQIELSVVYENEEDREIQKQRIEQLKASMLNLKENGFQTEKVDLSLYSQDSNKQEHLQPQFFQGQDNSQNLSQTYEEKTTQPQYSQVDDGRLIYRQDTIQTRNITSDEPENSKDDAIFITSRIKENEIPVQRKILPTNIEVDISSHLPAPKRNSNLEPTYKDMMSRLFERKKEKWQNKTTVKTVEQETPTQLSENYSDVGSFGDYGSLKKYYAGHNIEFKEFKSSNVEREHNTNYLLLLNSIALFLLSGIGCLITYGILAGVGILNVSTNFLLYTLPILFLIYAIYSFIKYKLYPSKKASLTYGCLVNWSIFLLGTMIVVIANVIAGMQVETFSEYCTSLVIPIFALLLTFPINYHIKKALFKKYAK